MPGIKLLISFNLQVTGKHLRTIHVQLPRMVHHGATQPLHAFSERLFAGGKTPAHEALAGRPEGRARRRCRDALDGIEFPHQEIAGLAKRVSVWAMIGSPCFSAATPARCTNTGAQDVLH